MFKNLLKIVLVFALGISLFSGCTSKEAESSDKIANDNNKIENNKKLIEPSDLITKKEAEELLGEPLKDGEITEQKVVGLKLCIYNSQNEDSIKSLQIGITQKSFMEKTVLDSGQTPKTLYKEIKENFKDSLKEIDGIGDEAFIATGGIYIISGEYYILISAGNTDNEEIIEILKKAGKIAVKKL